MDCHELENRLSEFLDGELDSESFSDAFTHISSCEQCAHRYEAFADIRKQIVEAKLPPPNPNLWNRIEERLVENQTRNATHASPAQLENKRPFDRQVWPLLMFAAAILVAITVWWSNQQPNVKTAATNPPHHAHSAYEEPRQQQQSAAINFEDLLRATEREPASALDLLTTQLVDNQSPASRLPNASDQYLTSLQTSLPTNVTAKNHQVIRMPQCNCGPGQCKCGPTGCICAVCLCQRNDGTQLLVIDHCETQDFSLGNLTLISNPASEEKTLAIELFKADRLYAASWVTDHRRRTVFGLTSPEEALDYARGSRTK